MLSVVRKLPFSFKKKTAIPSYITFREEQIDFLHSQLKHYARSIIGIQSQLNDIGAKESAYIQGWQNVLYSRLDSDERIFFIMYNQLRAMHGIDPLQGEKFTGEYNYSIHTRR
jgi:hypothetical protein